MEHDSEKLQRSVIQLLQELLPGAALDSETAATLAGQASPAPELADPEIPDVLDFLPEVPEDLVLDESTSTAKSSHLGDLAIVQDRYHALLKRRLETEIQRNPPLFPWETDIHDYEATEVGAVPVGAATPAIAQGCLQQLRQLNLPAPLPDTVLRQLFQRCQTLMQSSLLEGARLVAAVEDLFPDRAQALNYLAGMVMTSPARSATSAPASSNIKPYEEADPAQQMVLSLMAAREIFAALTLPLSGQQPTLERQWLTEAGALMLTASYTAIAPQRLRVEVELPQGGDVQLSDGNNRAIAQRTAPGPISVELLGLQPGQTSELSIQLHGTEAPLRFMLPIRA